MKTKVKSSGLTRRQALGLAGGAGAAYAVGGLVKVGSGESSVGLSEATAAATCTVAPQVTEGPYWRDEMLNRSDLASTVSSGTPLTITFTVLNSATCSAYEGAQVDIWHANAAGHYSDFSAEGTAGQTFLRGYQVTDSNGQCTFRTIFPGWYTGRTVHIHVRVRTFDGSSTTYNFTTQVFFEEGTTATVVAQTAYSKSGNRTTNTQDSIYGEEVTKGNALVPVLSGNNSSGYTGAVQISLAGLPSSGSGSGTTTEDTSVDGGLRKTAFRHERSGFRYLDVKVNANEKLAADAELMRGGKVIARKKITGLASGGVRTFSIPVANKVDAGKASLKVTLTDQAGNTKVLRRKVNVPAHR